MSAWGHRWRAIDLLETGDLSACHRELDALEALATQLHDAFHWWGVIVRRAGLALLTGPPDKAEPLVMEALGLADQIHSPYTLAATLNTLWALRWQQGRVEEIQDAVPDIAALSPAHGFLVPLLHRELDQADRAASTFEVLARDGFGGLLRWTPSVPAASTASPSSAMWPATWGQQIMPRRCTTPFHRSRTGWRSSILGSPRSHPFTTLLAS